MKKVALITGGTRGIGFGIAVEMARAGYDLAINGVREKGLVETQLSKIKNFSNKVIYCRGNIDDSNDRAEIIRQVDKSFGKIDVLINNAGIAPRERKDILLSTETSFNEVMGVNLKGPFFLTQSIANWMIELKKTDSDLSPCIINISSISATVASVNRGEYCISKSGLSMMTKLFAIRLGEFDIPVFEIRPGVTKTDMTIPVTEKYDTLINEGLCVQRRWGLPEDVGKAVVSLVSGSFSYSTGQVIMVDGGLTLPRL